MSTGRKREVVNVVVYIGHQPSVPLRSSALRVPSTDIPASRNFIFFSKLLHAGEGCADGGDTSDLSGSLEGAAGVVTFRDFGWYFESAGIKPPFYWMATVSEHDESRLQARGNEPIRVVLRLACSGEPRLFLASTLFARRSNASSCALDRGADGGHRSRGALWALRPCVFEHLWRRGGRFGCLCYRVVTGEDEQALLYGATRDSLIL